MGCGKQQQVTTHFGGSVKQVDAVARRWGFGEFLTAFLLIVGLKAAKTFYMFRKERLGTYFLTTTPLRGRVF